MTALRYPDSLWAKVDKAGPVPEYRPDLGVCWLWTGATMPNGYGNAWNGSEVVGAHRAVYELVVGPIPEGMDLDHLCRVRNCVRPSHVEPVTRSENMVRSPLVGAKTHCPAGHEYTEENTLTTPGQGRKCRTCGRIRQRDDFHGFDSVAEYEAAAADAFAASQESIDAGLSCRYDVEIEDARESVR